MNKNRTLYLFAIALAVMLFSCEKEEQEINIPIAGKSEITCYIDGEFHEYAGKNGNGLNHFDNNYPGSPDGNLIQLARYNSSLDIFTIDIWKNFDLITAPTVYENGSKPEDVATATDFSLWLVKVSSFTSYFPDPQLNDAKLTITYRDANSIAGVFEGTFVGLSANSFSNPNQSFGEGDDDFFQYDTIKIANGTFHMAIERGSIIPED